MPKRKFDPRLKAAMREIRQVLERYDIAGQVSLVSPTHSEFTTQFPTWSLAQFERDEKGAEVGIRFNTKGQRFVSKRGKHKAVEASVHMIDSFRHLSAVQFSTMESVLSMLMEHFEIDRTHAHAYPHDEAGEIAARDPRNQARETRWRY